MSGATDSRKEVAVKKSTNKKSIKPVSGVRLPSRGKKAGVNSVNGSKGVSPGMERKGTSPGVGIKGTSPAVGRKALRLVTGKKMETGAAH